MEFRVCVLWVPGSGLGFGVQQFQIEHPPPGYTIRKLSYFFEP